MSTPLLFAKADDGYFFKVAGSVSNPADTPPILHIGSQSTSLVKSEFFPVSGIQSAATIIGIIRLRTARYVLVATKSQETGRIREHSIHKVAEYQILALRNNNSNSSSAQILDEDEKNYLELLKFHLDSATLYFSYTYDLTNSHQRQSQISPGEPVWKTADPRFFWNSYVNEELIQLASTADSRFSPFITPLIYGYAHIINTVTNGAHIQFGIITRRSRLRAGTRYFRRGIDAQGNVANYNETEQILVVPASSSSISSTAAATKVYETYSYLQTRGSVPVYWAEVNNLKYKPDLSIGGPPLEAARQHFDQQVALYGKNYLVNLVDNKGYELPVKNSYESVVAALSNDRIQYVYFDYHHECRKFQWHRVKLLIDHLTQLGLSQQDFYHERRQLGQSPEILNSQQSVVRTNCMDCLDRTNVVQSTLAHWVLQRQLEIAGVVSTSSVWESDVKLLFQFQNIWADNADYVSKAYSGTGALKTDYTRTGKRTKVGAWNDLCNSVTRYYKNNLKDGSRQDAYDLFLGNFAPFEAVGSPFEDQRPTTVQMVPYSLLASAVLFLLTCLYPKGSLWEFNNVLLLTSCFSVFGWSARYVFQNGLQYVNWPKLVQPEFLKRSEIFTNGHKTNGFSFTKNSAFTSAKGASKSD